MGQVGESDRLRRIEELLDEALQRPADERESFLREACPDDSVRAEVAALLAGHAEAVAYFDTLQGRLGDASEVEAEAGVRLGRTLGPYRVVGVIGAGGMGTVYLGERADGAFEQRVAIKLVRAARASPVALDRFRSERQILARLDHPDVARLLDGGVTDDGLPYLVMEHVPGRPLTEFCDAHGLTVRERVRLFIRLGEAVQHLHRHLVVHRDIKPANVLVTDEGHLKLLDFGIAKLLDASAGPDDGTMTVGRALTPQYAAPEQIRGEAITTATDVYQLGTVLYELLAGRRPFQGAPDASPHETERSVLEEDPPRPSAVAQGELRRTLKGDLDAICAKALRKRPAERYGSVEQLVGDLERWRVGLPVEARRGSMAYRARKFLRRHRVGVAAASLVLALSVSFGVLAWAQASRLERERDRAEAVVSVLVDVFTVADPGTARGETVTAREVLDRAADRLAARLDDEPVLRAELLTTMGVVYRNLGLYDRASPLLEEALALRREVSNGANGEAASLAESGELRRLQGDFEGARRDLEEAVRLTDGRGAVATVRARALNRLGLVLLATGALERADTTLGSALALGESGAAGSIEYAETLQNLGALAAARGDLDAAEPHFRQALALREGTLGSDHPAVAATLNNLSTILARRGALDEAITLQRRALEQYERLLPPEHPRIATLLNNLGAMLYSSGDPTGAEAPLRRSVSMRRTQLGDDHPELAQSLANLGLVLQALGESAGAERAQQEALDIRRRAYGDDHPLVAQSLNNLGLLRLQRGDPTGAEALYRQALGVLEQSLGSDHPLVATNVHNLAGARAAQGDRAGAAELYRRALEVRRRVLPAAHAHTAETLYELGALLLASGDASGAEPLLDEAVTMRRRVLPAGDSRIAEAELDLERARSAARGSR